MAAVSYLNTTPLVWGFLDGPQKGLLDVDFCVPSECADRVRDGVADIGIIPVVEVARQGLDFLEGTGIACDGAVRSILLVSKCPYDEIRTLAADSSSRTSVMLSRVILQKRYGVDPVMVSMPPDLDQMLRDADAALIIGDPALRVDVHALPYRALDLGVEWKELTGLPMVFAVWAGRKQILSPELERLFIESCEFGIRNMDRIVEFESKSRNLPAEFVREYLTRNLVLRLGEEHYQGMRKFLACAAELEQVTA